MHQSRLIVKVDTFYDKYILHKKLKANYMNIIKNIHLLQKMF